MKIPIAGCVEYSLLPDERWREKWPLRRLPEDLAIQPAQGRDPLFSGHYHPRTRTERKASRRCVERPLPTNRTIEKRQHGNAMRRIAVYQQKVVIDNRMPVGKAERIVELINAVKLRSP